MFLQGIGGVEDEEPDEPTGDGDGKGSERDPGLAVQLNYTVQCVSKCLLVVCSNDEAGRCEWIPVTYRSFMLMTMTQTVYARAEMA